MRSSPRSRTPRKVARRVPYHLQLQLEPLEHRLLLASFTVDDAQDLADGNIGDGICLADITTGGGCTLRAAIQEANALANTDNNGDATPDPDTINVPAGTYTLTLIGEDENAAATGDLDITDAVTLVGAGAAVTTIEAASTSGSGTDRVFQIIGSEGGTDVNISGVTIRHGNVSGDGGGIHHFQGTGTLTLSDCIVSDNNATDEGGGIASFPGTGSLTITNCTISGNSAGGGDGGGGGIFHAPSTGDLTIINSTVSNNQLTNSETAGGGIYHGPGDGTLTITNSTISANQLTGLDSDGAGVFHAPGTGAMTITNSTISGNTATGRGGGIARLNGDGAILNSTITGNSATEGGGIFEGSTFTTTLQNTIVANSTSGGDFGGTLASFSSLGNNLSSDNSGATFLIAAGDQINTDPLLGPLADNGGPTLTHLPQPGSPAIDTGNNTGAPATDQRGIDRPQPPSGIVDIGAVEVVCSLVITTTSDVVDSGDALNSLREAIICANVTPGADTITVPAGTYTLTIAGTDEDAAATGDLDVTDHLTIDGAGSATTIIEGCALDVSLPGCTGLDRIFHLRNGAGGQGGPTDLSISGITIRHGLVAGGGRDGGGISKETSGTLDISNSVITDNTADDQGGGIFNGGGGVTTITASAVTNNQTIFQGRGGGIYHSGGSLSVTDSNIDNNATQKAGGGIANNSGTVTILRSTVNDNTSDDRAGGLLNTGTSMTITDSTVSGNNTGFSGGGGIYNRIDLTLTNVDVTLNDANGPGAGIWNDSNATITDSTITGNRAFLFANGGGLYNNNGSVSIARSTIASNVAAANGGGIYTQGIPGTNVTLELEESLLFDNLAGAEGGGNGGSGGAIYNDGDAVTLENVTISGNSAPTQGGGIYQGVTTSGSMNILNVTITNNTAPAGSNIFTDGAGPIEIQNTIVSFGQESSNCNSPITSLGHNLEDTDTCGFDQTGDLPDTPPQLDQTLRDNGGPTLTHALCTAVDAPVTGCQRSPAIDAGDTDAANAAELTTDQRGTGFARIIGAAVDIGAFEVQQIPNNPPTVLLADDNPLSVDEGTTQTYNFSIDDQDGDDITSVTVSCGANGTQVGTATFTNTSGSFQCSFPDGPANSTVSASATDSHEDSGPADTQIVTVNNVAPTVALSAANDLIVNEGTTHTYNFTISDPGVDTITGVTVSCGANSTQVGTATFTNSTGSFQCNFPDGPASSTVSASATDSDQGTGTADTQVVTVNNVAPTVVLGATNDLTVDEGTTHTYNFTISDPGVDTITGVTVSCGANGTQVGTATFTNSSGSFQCNFPDGPASSTVSASATDSDQGTGIADTQTVTVNNVAPTVVLAGTNDVIVNEGTTHTYNFTISDPGGDTITGVTVSCGANGTQVGTATFTNSSGSFQCNFPNGPANSTVSASATDSDGSTGAAAEQSVFVVGGEGGADLEIDKSADQDTVTVGEELTYTIEVRNNGPEDATDVTVTDILTGDVEFVSAEASIGDCTFFENVVTCLLGTLSAGIAVTPTELAGEVIAGNGGEGNTATVTIVVRPLVGGQTLTNAATVTSEEDDPNGDNDESVVTTTVREEDEEDDERKCTAGDGSRSGSGDVSVKIAQKKLTIRGDGQGNNLLIEAGERRGSLRIRGRGDTTVNGETEPVELRGFKDVLVAMGAGTDVVAIVDALVENGLRVKMQSQDDDLILCGIEAQGNVRTGAGRGKDKLAVDDSVFHDDAHLGIGNGDDEIDIERKGKKNGPSTKFEKRLKIRTEKGNDDIKIGKKNEDGNSVKVDECTLVLGGQGTDSFEADAEDNKFDCGPDLKSIEE